MTQLGLFDVPRTHTGDPPTSHRAEAAGKQRAKAHARIVLAVVRHEPGLSGSEIASRLDGHRQFSQDRHTRLYQVRRRLSDLRVAELVRRQSVTGRRETLWFAVDGD
jgi:hypothetical protein